MSLLIPEKDEWMIQRIQAAVEKRRRKGAIPANARYAVANPFGDYVGLNLDFLETLGDAEGLNGIYWRGSRGWT